MSVDYTQNVQIKEKRTAVRSERALPVKFHSSYGDWQDGMILNRSSSGLLLEASVRLSLGERITVYYDRFTGAQVGRVVRFEEVQENLYQIALHFMVA